jgi:hypothetical protein
LIDPKKILLSPPDNFEIENGPKRFVDLHVSFLNSKRIHNKKVFSMT